MDTYDYLVLVVYLGFMVSIGLMFRRFNRDSSDYFRVGGQAAWYMVGATAFMTQFSSWTFTGAASKAYRDGLIVLAIYLGNALGYGVAYLWSAARFRQMRVVTPMEGVRDRFGARNEQFFTWLWMPLGMIYAAIWLNAMSTFASAIFDVDPMATIVVLGTVVLLVASIGGGGAVMASDFIQMVILFPVAIVVAVLALQAVGDGHVIDGAGRLATAVSSTRRASQASTPTLLLALWVGATLLKQLCTTNSMNDSHRFLIAVNSRAARRAALMAAVLFVVGPIIWFIPPLAASMLYPDLSAVPQLTRLGNRLSEGAYLAIGLTQMPAGMVGLMAAAVFGVTMSSMDTGLNKCAGIFIRNFYKPVLRPAADEREYLRVGQVTSVVCGVIVILLAIALQRYSDVPLFDVMMLFSSMAVVPFAIPLIWGIAITRSPDWSAWSTVCVGMLMSMLSPTLLDSAIVHRVLGFEPVMRAADRTDWLFAGTLILNVVVGSAWFLGSCLFVRFISREQRARQDAFAARIRTPVTDDEDAAPERGLALTRSLALLCLPYGALVALFAVIPNTIGGRVSFLFTGAFLMAIGGLLWMASRPRAPAADAAPGAEAAVSSAGSPT